jgi:prevent-host-death family protein
MKTTSVRDLRSHLSEVIDGGETVLVTRHGKPAAVVYSLRDPKKVPPEVRQELFLALTAEIAEQLEAKGVTEDEIQRDFAAHQKRRRR